MLPALKSAFEEYRLTVIYGTFPIFDSFLSACCFLFPYFLLSPFLPLWLLYRFHLRFPLCGHFIITYQYKPILLTISPKKFVYYYQRRKEKAPFRELFYCIFYLFLCFISRMTAITAPYSTPATAQMIQLYRGCPLPLGPKVYSTKIAVTTSQ